MKAEELWRKFCQEKNIAGEVPYEAWAFGGAPDELAELVCKGMKTGTASAYDLYALDDSEPLPKPETYSVILNSREEAVCVIKTTKVTLVPFDQVTADHAFKEGEGDRSLAYWRRVHEEFFRDEFAAFGLEFHEKRLIVCEEFELVYLQ